MMNWEIGGRIHSSGALTPPQFFLNDIAWRLSSVSQLQIAFIQNLKYMWRGCACVLCACSCSCDRLCTHPCGTLGSSIKCWGKYTLFAENPGTLQPVSRHLREPCHLPSRRAQPADVPNLLCDFWHNSHISEPQLLSKSMLS